MLCLVLLLSGRRIKTLGWLVWFGLITLVGEEQHQQKQIP